ncbi:hypothetical protein TWF694_002154 [Orbilia ellipsospora]|uniref:Serine peptidase n=1 Tax=Orbilia ellipsospora TaxID=2528407 RepID=A0AAV9X4P7_9PEZI
MASRFLLAASLLSAAWAYPSQSAPNMYNRMMRPPNPDTGETIYSANATFTQLIDHSNPDLGTFEQFYYYGTQYWKGPGSPVVFMTPGEGNATGYDSYLHENRTTGLIAKEIGAAVVVVEHRYWGTSTPCTDLTAKCLQHLTLRNSIADFVRFAKEVKLPFDTSGQSNADNAPWIMIGGSYPGALAAWTAAVDDGTFWAYYASSGPVQAMDYWQYFSPIQEGMPKNCSKDIGLVVDHVDNIGFNGTPQQKKALQRMFGLGDLEHYDDFASSLQNGPWLWQGNSMTGNSGFFDFCDAIEGVNRKINTAAGNNRTIHGIPGAEGVGLQKALEGYAAWMKFSLIPDYCKNLGYSEWTNTNDTGCFNSYDASSPLYTDTSLSNQVDRQWVWMTCNEPLGYWQDSPPAGQPSIVSRFVTEEYWTRQCKLYFPDDGTYGAGPSFGNSNSFEPVNDWTGGWYINDTQRLLYVNGQFDPWRDAGVSSDYRPGGPLESTEQTPIFVVPGGFHCTDLVPANGRVNPGVKATIDAAVQQIVTWVGEYPKNDGGSYSSYGYNH